MPRLVAPRLPLVLLPPFDERDTAHQTHAVVRLIRPLHRRLNRWLASSNDPKPLGGRCLQGNFRGASDSNNLPQRRTGSKGAGASNDLRAGCTIDQMPIAVSVEAISDSVPTRVTQKLCAQGAAEGRRWERLALPPRQAPNRQPECSRIKVKGGQNQIGLTGIARPATRGMPWVCCRRCCTSRCTARLVPRALRRPEPSRATTTKFLGVHAIVLCQDPCHPHNAKPRVMIRSARPIKMGSWLAKKTVIGSGWQGSKSLHVFDHPLSRVLQGSSSQT